MLNPLEARNIMQCYKQLWCRGVGAIGGKGAQALSTFNWGGPCPCNFEPWHLLIKVASDEFTHTTHKEM